MRRRAIGGLACLALGLFALSCGDDAEEAGGGAGAETKTGTLTFVSWGGAYQDAQTVAFTDPWAKETGNKVVHDGPTDYAKIKVQVQSGNVEWDVVDVEGYFDMGKNCGTLFEKLDYSVIDKSRLAPKLVSDCGAPAMQYNYVLMYDKKKFGDNPPTSWADFFDTAKFPGKRGIWNYVSGGQLEAALLADGVPADEIYPIDYDRAFKVLDRIKGDIAFYDAGAQQQQQMESGEVAMSLAWTGRAYSAVENGASFEPAWKDNIAVYEHFTIPKGSKNKDLAMQFIAYATSAQAQARLTETIPYAPINLDAKPKVSEQLRRFLATNPDVEGQSVVQDMQWYADNFDEASRRWVEWTQG